MKIPKNANRCFFRENNSNSTLSGCFSVNSVLCGQDKQLASNAKSKSLDVRADLIIMKGCQSFSIVLFGSRACKRSRLNKLKTSHVPLM